MSLFIITMPLNLLKNFSALRHFSMIVLGIVFFSLMVSVVQTPLFYLNFRYNPNYTITLLAKGFKIKWLQGMGTMLLAFNCQIPFFVVRREMNSKNPKRMKQLFNGVGCFEFLFFSIIALAGYISLGDKLLPGIFILRNSLSKLKI